MFFKREIGKVCRNLFLSWTKDLFSYIGINKKIFIFLYWNSNKIDSNQYPITFSWYSMAKILCGFSLSCTKVKKYFNQVVFNDIVELPFCLYAGWVNRSQCLFFVCVSKAHMYFYLNNIFFLQLISFFFLVYNNITMLFYKTFK